MSLVLGTLGVEQDTLAGLTGPSSILGNAGLLRANVAGEGLGAQSLLAEEEELLGEVELPLASMLVTSFEDSQW